jgi:hypothetical protein
MVTIGNPLPAFKSPSLPNQAPRAPPFVPFAAEDNPIDSNPRRRKITMAKKATKLSIVKPTEEELERAHNQESDGWTALEKSWRITEFEARQRVLALRDELERYREQLDAAPFDIACGDSTAPASLGVGERKYTVYLAMDLNPIVDALFEEIDSFARKHGPGIYRAVDFNSKLFDLRDHSVETGFKVGVLAGVIFSGAPKEVIDRFERGLAYAMKSDGRIVKGRDNPYE